MIYVLEGPDGVGKTTLANEIYTQTKGHILHCTWKKEFDMSLYFTEIMTAATRLNKYQDVVVDRWAPSEKVYGEAFRGGQSFNVQEYIKLYIWSSLFSKELGGRKVKFIICENENAVENHKKLLAEREEMFDDMTKIVEGFKIFVDETPWMNWIHYDYDKVDMKQFVEDLVHDDKTN